MKKMNILLRTAAVAAVIVSAGVLPASAHFDYQSRNNTTGSRSQNRNMFSYSSEWMVRMMNSSMTTNDVMGRFNTGGNETSRNTRSGHNSTGRIAVGVSLENHANARGTDSHSSARSSRASGSTTHSNSDGSGSVDFSNSRTGANSENSNEAIIAQDTSIMIENSSEIDNTVDLDANTGNNSTTSNTVVGDNRTGDIVVGVELENVTHAASVNPANGMGGGDVDVNFENDTTGFNSENTNAFTVNNTFDYEETNTSEIDNTIAVQANSGGNETSRNTSVGGNETGDIRIHINASNHANQ